ncbi:MAG: PAS domain-containing protein, partial [Gammaproteobacteria bacterium]
FDLHPGFARALLETLPGGVAFIDRHGRVQWASAAFAALLGTDPRRLVGRAADTLPFPRVETASPVERYASVGELVVVERVLDEEPLVGRVLQILPRPALAAVLPATRTLPADLPVPQGVLARDTGLQRLVVEISRSRRYENPLSCLVGRVDAVDAGATARGMSTLTILLKEQLRWVDVLVHWDTDRLLVLLPETGAEAAPRLLHKLARLVDLHWPAEVGDVRVRWGTATWRRGDDALRLVRRAEAASRVQPAGGLTRLDR